MVLVLLSCLIDKEAEAQSIFKLFAQNNKASQWKH